MSYAEQLDARIADLLKLSRDDRVYIAERLMDSTGPVIDEPVLAEYCLRDQELEEGTVVGVPAHEAIAAARKELRQSRRVHPNGDQEVDEAWARVAVRRAGELKACDVTGVPIDAALELARKAVETARERRQ